MHLSDAGGWGSRAGAGASENRDWPTLLIVILILVL